MDSYKAAEGMGIKLKKRWLATLDNRTRHAHAKLDGQTVDVDKPFEIDGKQIMYPGDRSAAGYLVYNCRCTTIAVLPDVDMSDAQRWSIDPETGERKLVSDMSYQEWAGWKEKEQKTVANAAVGGIIDVVESATGAKQGTPIQILDAVNGANPGYSLSNAYKINCQRCVQTYEMRRRGYDVIAKPKPSNGNTIVWGSECFIKPGEDAYKVFSMNRTAASVKKEILSSPDGARYVVYTEWKSRIGGAHVFVAEKDSGVARYLDPQTAKDDVEYYFSLGKPGKFGLFRLDDKSITTDGKVIAETMEVL